VEVKGPKVPGKEKGNEKDDHGITKEKGVRGGRYLGDSGGKVALCLKKGGEGVHWT